MEKTTEQAADEMRQQALGLKGMFSNLQVIIENATKGVPTEEKKKILAMAELCNPSKLQSDIEIALKNLTEAQRKQNG